MAKEYISIRNLKFLLYEVMDIQKLNVLPKFSEYDKEAYDMTIDAAKSLSDTYLYPIFRDMDKKKAYYDEESKSVKVHPGLPKAIKALGDGGWIGSYASYDQGGQQMPLLLLNACRLIFHAGNANAAAYTLLTDGAANLIRAFGSEELHDVYLQPTRLFC